MAERWFVDTGFVIAMVSSRDSFNDVAVQLSSRIEMDSIQLVTTDAVLLEIGAALSKLTYRAVGVEIIHSLRRDPKVEVHTLNPALLDKAVTLFSARADKEWSLADCVSFELMREQNIAVALSADAHFEQAGFIALMRAH